MKILPESDNLTDYLKPTEIIDFEHPAIKLLADKLSKGINSESELIKNIYEYVRDKISHSADISGKSVTCKASEVLEKGEGICYAKSHLLAALLRRSKIPAGFCYQLLRLTDGHSPLILHGLNAVYLKELGKWIRIDARGNKNGIDAQFNIDHEQLAFPINTEIGEIDYHFIFTDPDSNVIKVLTGNKSLDELWGNLPTSLYIERISF